MENSKPLVIYHASCLDGYAAAFAAWLTLGDEAEYVACSYGEDGLRADLRYDCTIEGRDVYILDFSFDRDLMNFYFTHAKRVVWLDHHKSAFEMWLGEFRKGDHHIDHGYDEIHNRWITLDDNKSGAMLAWEYFHPGTEVPMLIRMIDDRDRWQFKTPGSRELNAAIWSLA